MKKKKSKPVILIVDDEKEVRTILADFLKIRYNCDMKEAGNGEEATAFIKNNPCDIIILDVRMPKKGGMEVIKEAKKIDPNIDILIVSAWVSTDVAEEAIKLGATDYIVKPVDLKALNLKFANILERRGQKISKT